MALLALLVCLPVLSACSFDLDSIVAPPSYEEAREAAERRMAPVVAPPTILEEGTLVVGLRPSSSLVPLTIVGESGELSGVEVDIASALANELGLAVQFVSVSSIEESLGVDCDIIMGVELGEDTSATVVSVYAERAATFFAHGGNSSSSVAELSGKTVALQQSSASQEMLSQTNLIMVEHPYESLNEAFDALDEGSADYVLCEAYPGAYLASHYRDVSVAGTLEVPSTLGVAVSPTNTALQTSVQSVLDSLQANGAMAVIRARWLGGMENLSNANLVVGLQALPQPSEEELEGINEDEELTEHDLDMQG